MLLQSHAIAILLISVSLSILRIGIILDLKQKKLTDYVGPARSPGLFQFLKSRQYYMDSYIVLVHR